MNPALAQSLTSSDTVTEKFTLRAPGGASQVIEITISGADQVPIASSQQRTTDEDTPLAITLTGTDGDTAELTFAVTAGPSHGVLTGEGASLTYTPSPNYHGDDSFQFRAHD